MCFVYYVPKLQTAPPTEQFAALGLGHAFDTRPAFQGTQKGADGDSGLWMGPEALLTRIGRDNLESRRIPGTDAWVARFRGDPQPKPEEIARDPQLAGHWITMADGQDWLCPIARGLTEQDGELRWYNALPQRLDMDEQGRWSSGAVVEKFAPLWTLAARWEDTLVGTIGDVGDDRGEQITFEFQDAIESAVACLAVNYRVGPVECALLGLLTDDNWQKILHALIDWPTRAEWIQKKIQQASEATNSSVGEAA